MALAPNQANLNARIDLSMNDRRRALQDKVAGTVKAPAPDTIHNYLSDERAILEINRSSRVQNYTPTNVETNTQEVSDLVTIIDIDYNGVNQGIKSIELPFIPRELNWNSESNFVGIKPMGRNNPKYHFTGSEDKLEFEIDWHSMDTNRDDVIRKCRLIEALSKGDGYNNPPHRVLLQWGQNDILFRDMVFIVTAAPYRMTQFNKSQGRGTFIESNALLPVQAYQKVVLSRITHNNLTSEQIRIVSL